MNSFRLATVKNTMLIYVPALSATTFRLGPKNCFSVEPVLSIKKIERIAKTAQYHDYVSFL
jgi:hypothetical protein